MLWHLRTGIMVSVWNIKNNKQLIPEETDKMYVICINVDLDGCLKNTYFYG